MSLSFLITLGATVLLAAVTAGLFASNRRLKTLLGGIGLSLVPFGLYLLGITDLAVNGVSSLIDWAQSTYFDNVMTIGAVLLGAGILLAIIGVIVPRRIVLGRAAPKATTAPGAATAVTAPPNSPGKPGTAKRQPAGKDKESEDEIEEILRRRGIM